MPLPRQELEWNYYVNSHHTVNRNDNPYNRRMTQTRNNEFGSLTMPKNVKRVKKRKKLSLKGKIIILGLIAFVVGVFAPSFLRNITKPVLLAQTPNKSINYSNYGYLAKPTSKYLYNSDFNNAKMLVGINKSPLMKSLYTEKELTSLKQQLKAQIAQNPKIDAAIYVFDITNGNYVDIQADKPFPAASIIKIPVLISLFKSIENGKLEKNEHIPLEEYYRSSGSGFLQYKPQGYSLNIDSLARIMITDSDNSATNMLMSAIGSMTAVNDDVKSWGLKNTHINTWLPDLDGTNYTTTKDLATMLSNLDNEEFLSLESRADIFDYMGHVKNDRLLAAGIPGNASIAHKTGDIGTMLGDAGIIYSPNGRRYITAILVKRPYNDYSAKEFIVNASKTIYNYMTTY